MENRNCKNCKQDFIIEPDDFSFYEKIGVPPPTWCPECRMIRRFNFRNDRVFHRKKCDVPGHTESLVSIFPENCGFTVYDHAYWWSDDWDSVTYGMEYDFSRPFFEQFAELMKKVPVPNSWSYNLVNSEYGHYSVGGKNIYFSTSVSESENINYSSFMDRDRDCTDSYKITDSEYTYQCLNGQKLSFCRFAVNCRECIDSWYLFDCVNCQNCFMSSNLRNKQYYIRNKKYTREEYMDLMKDIDLGSYEAMLDFKKEFGVLMKNSIHKFANTLKAVDSTGDDLMNVKNCKSSFAIDNSENIKYSWRAPGSKDVYDTSGLLKSELIYEATVGGVQSYGNKFYSHSTTSSNISYCWFCPNSAYSFGCAGLRKKEYCILNKQYTKEAYEELVPKIIKHMTEMPYVDAQGRTYGYGEFFPPELSPFCYNETIAQEYFPITKEKALGQGYKWSEKEKRNYVVDIKTEDLPDSIQNADGSIVGKVTECANKGAKDYCTEAFKMTPEEVDFYRKMNVPLPRYCSNCRHYERLEWKNPFHLWHRKCMNGGCNNEFETSYAPDRPERVYCESCYQREVL